MVSLKLAINFLLVIAVCNNAAAATVNDKFKEFLEEFRKRMCGKIKGLDLPTLDPLEIKTLEQSIGEVKFGVENFKLSELSKFTIEKAKVAPIFLQFTLELKLENLILESDYTAVGDVGIIHLNGKGKLKLSVKKIIVQLQVRLGRTDDFTFVIIKEFNVKFENFKLKITGLFPNKETNDIINKLINQIGKEVFDDLWEEKRQDIYTVLSELVSEKVKDLDPIYLIKLISGDEPIFGEDDPPTCPANNK